MDESTGVPSSAATGGEDNVYDYVEWKTGTKHESATQSEEIELSTNVAYGKVQRSAFQIYSYNIEKYSTATVNIIIACS